MASQNGAPISIRELKDQQLLLDQLFHILNIQLSNHNLKQEGIFRAQYHVTIRFDTTQGPTHERLVITWLCDYCQVIYRHAQSFNNQYNNLYRWIRNIDPIGHPLMEDRMFMTNWLQPLFPPVPIELLLKALSTATQNEEDEERGAQAPRQEPGNINGSAYDDIWQR